MNTKPPKWKRAGPDGELEIKFPTGRRFIIEKQYDYNDRHKGEWMVKEWIKGDWEWVETYSPKWYAKENVMRMGQYDKNRKKVADYSSTFQSESTSYDCKNCAEYGSEFCKYCLQEEMMTTGDAGIPQDTKNMGPRFKPKTVTDRRRKKDKHPVLLKRFRKYMEDNA